MDPIKEAFETFGLRRKEVKIMLGLSTCKSVSTSGLARLIKLPRTTIIPILEELKERDFVEVVRIKNHGEWKMAPLSVFREKLEGALKVFEEK
jgi:sugar-specific transcriptional regulator TrmB